MIPNIISQNVNYYQGDILIVDSYIESMYPDILKELSGGKTVVSFCPELTHLDVLGLKVTTILRLKRVTSLTVLTKDGSPHTIQIPFMIQEAVENTDFDKKNVFYYAIEQGKLYPIDDLSVRKARHLSMIQDLMPFAKLVKTVDILCSENGCKNERAETYKSVLAHLYEELAELQQAFEKQDKENFFEEAGDILFNLMLLLKIANNNHEKTLNAWLDDLSNKMIERHPNVFTGTYFKY